MRKIYSFHGGIHPAENKIQSLRTPIADAGVPEQLTLPLSQHIGAPASPVVSVGTRVLKGQLIAEAAGFVSVPIHAPSSGIVTAIEDRQIAHPSGHTARCIVIDTDGKDEWVPLTKIDNYRSLDKQQLLQRIREAGIAGMGGAGFPAAVKLSVRPGTHIQTLIINGTECEPYITADDILMRERASEIIEGAEILTHLIEPDETLIGVEDNKPAGLAALRSAATGTTIEVVAFPTKYPSGGEKQLIEILTGKQVPSGGLPSDVGVICQNLGSTVAIRDAVIEGRPLISRITTVTGECVAQPQNFEVLLGTSMEYLLAKAEFQAEHNTRLIMGGPMMGFTVPQPSVPIVKTTNCILAPSEAELPTPPPAQACIRCGLCAQACPASLLPQQLFWFAQGREFEKAEQHNLFDCIECGACSYVCPSNIPLVQYYRAAKAEVLQLRRDHEKAEHSKIRFEARQERLAMEEAEKQAKRAARKLAAEEKARKAAAGGDEVDPIQAAIERAKAKKAANNKIAQEAAADEPASQSDSPAQAAIAKAMAARDAEATLSPNDKARAQLEKLQQRLEKSTARLAASRDNGDEAHLIEALESTVSRLQDKVSEAKSQMQETEES